MLSDHRGSFLFVHVQKTGGDTVSRLLRENLDGVQRVAPKHARIDAAPVDLVAPSTFSFGFVRNPWDRLVSWYSMINDASRINRWSAMRSKRARSHRRQAQNSPFWRYVLREAPDFASFVENCTAEVSISPGYSVCASWPQISYLSTGDTTVDHVFRFEEFATELAVVAQRLGISATAIPHENPSHHGEYRSFYDARRRDVVAGRFAADIDAYGYEF